MPWLIDEVCKQKEQERAVQEAITECVEGGLEKRRLELKELDRIEGEQTRMKTWEKTPEVEAPINGEFKLVKFPAAAEGPQATMAVIIAKDGSGEEMEVPVSESVIEGFTALIAGADPATLPKENQIIS